MFACKINIQHNFIRSDLVLRSWNALKMQKNWIGSSRLEINRDSVFIVVKDNSIRFKEPQFGEDDNILNKWASPQYLSHLVSKKEMKVDIKSDPLLDATLGHTYIGPAPAGQKETGIKINVGMGYRKPEAADDKDKNSGA